MDGWALIEVEDNAGIFHEKETDDGHGIKIVDRRLKGRFGEQFRHNDILRAERTDADYHQNSSGDPAVMMRALIVDDEIYSREELESMLKETGEFIVLGKCANAVEAIRAINRERPDVLFLDIQMPAINGFELLSMIDEKVMPSVVFVTAYDEYALKAFEENALDYLLKPVEKERLAKTVEKLKKTICSGRKTGFCRARYSENPLHPFLQNQAHPRGGNRVCPIR